METRGGFVSYGSTRQHLEELILAAAEQHVVTWTAAEGAEDGDLVVFYFTKPVGAFLAYGRVVRRSKERWGRDRKPMAEVGMIRLFPEPVTVRRAKERLRLPWLNMAQGFAKRRQDNVSLLLALGGVTGV